MNGRNVKLLVCCAFATGATAFCFVSGQSRAQPKDALADAVAVAAADVTPLALASDGQAEVFVLSDGRVVVTEDDRGQHLGLQIKASSPVYLGYGGNEFFLFSDSANDADKSVRMMPAVLRAPLAADPEGCANAVLHIAGHVQITQDTEGQWTLRVVDDSMHAFGLTFDVVGSGVADVPQGARAPRCTATCVNGSCECEGYHVCWCFCGVFGEPHCIGLFPGEELTILI